MKIKKIKQKQESGFHHIRHVENALKKIPSIIVGNAVNLFAIDASLKSIKSI